MILGGTTSFVRLLLLQPLSFLNEYNGIMYVNADIMILYFFLQWYIYKLETRVSSFFFFTRDIVQFWNNLLISRELSFLLSSWLFSALPPSLVCLLELFHSWFLFPQEDGSVKKLNSDNLFFIPYRGQLVGSWDDKNEV